MAATHGEANGDNREKPMSGGISFYRFASVVSRMCKLGVSVREMAKVFGMSKSAMGRHVQMIRAIEAIGINVEDLGQSHENTPAISTADQSPTVPDAAIPADNTAPEQGTMT